MTCAISGKQDQTRYSASLRVRRRTAETQPPPRFTGKRPQSQRTGPVFYSTKKAQWPPFPARQMQCSRTGLASGSVWCARGSPHLLEPTSLPPQTPPPAPSPSGCQQLGSFIPTRLPAPTQGLLLSHGPQKDGWVNQGSQVKPFHLPGTAERQTVFLRSHQGQALAWLLHYDFPQPLSFVHKTISSVADTLRVIPEYQLGITSMEVYFFLLQVKGGS